MNKENEKKSVELTDDDLNDVVGGRPGDAWQRAQEERDKKREAARKDKNKKYEK